MAGEEQKQESAPQEAPASGGSSKILLILTALNLLITLGIVGALVVSFKKDAAKPVVEDIAVDEGAEEGEGGVLSGGNETKREFGKMITLDPFTVNLSTVGSISPKFAKVNISIQVQNEDTEHEVGQKMPQVRNTVIDLFNSKRSADLATSEQRSFLKDEIKNAINSFLVTGEVTGVYFTNFAVSS